MADNNQRVDDYVEEDGEDNESIGEIDGKADNDSPAEEIDLKMDVQGIPWGILATTREKERRLRNLQFQNDEDVPADKEFKPTAKGGDYYDYFCFAREVKPTIPRVQLMNMVWATSKHDVYFHSNLSIFHWSSMHRQLSEVLNFSGHIVPTERHAAGNLLEGFTTKISTMAVWDRFLVVGGFRGEIVCKCLDKEGVSFCTRASHEDNAITNSVEIYKSISGGCNFMTSNDDCKIREYNMETYELIHHYKFPWAVKHTSVSPDRGLFAVVGANTDGLLVDARIGKTVASVVGHRDYSFASAWHPEGHYLATGNQDKTCRVWDVRNISKAVAVLKGNVGAARSVRFSSDGRFLVFAESADFVHIYDSKDDYKSRQELDFFGGISGVSLSPDDESLFVGVCCQNYILYSGLLLYNRRHQYGHLDSFT